MATAIKAITQKTFDEVVQENINEFEMEPDEALKDAVDQFESQGINLNLIIKEVAEADGKHNVEKLVIEIQKILQENDHVNDNLFQDILPRLIKELQQDLSKKYQVCKTLKATETLFHLCSYLQNKESFEAFSSIIDGQPDELQYEHLLFVINLLSSNLKQNKPEIISILIRILKHGCVKHEKNRQNVVKLNGVEILLKTAETYSSKTSIVRHCCSVLRTLTLDDDVREAFGKAHDHAKTIASEFNGLERLIKLAKDHLNSTELVNEICLTLSKILVRNEYCQELADLGGLTLINTLVNENLENMAVVKSCVILLKTACGNDEVKVNAVKNGCVDMLVQVLTKYIDHPLVCKETFSALTMLSLRNPAHCMLIMEKKAAPLIVQIMKMHPENAQLQKQACMLIRNLVARTRENSAAFVEQGVERLIRDYRLQHKAVLDDEAKAALRDLDLEVELKEIWRGQTKGITA